ncbi:MAG: amino acid permease, partial [Citrobacter freundii]|nr:amino acid permease [Citrobacter freundii]
VNNLELPVTFTKSYSLYAGATDAMVQWWYGHNAVGFFLTAGFLGMMYYFVPKQAERPVYSYRLSIVHFWALIAVYIWAGPHHLHYTALPDWAQSLGMVMSLQMVMFAYGGIEIIGITAGEAKDPEKSIPRAINSVPMRILVFYVGTLFVIMSIYPWNQVGTDGSPFVMTFQHMGITFAAGILNFVVLTASLSAINSDVFGVGRMLHGMAEQGSAPKMFAKTSRRGVPWVTVMVMTIALLFAVYLNYIMPENVFLVIASLATFATVWVWIMILLSQIAFRRRLPPEEVKALKFKVPGGVTTTIVGLIFLVFIIALIGYHPDTRISLYVGFAWIVLLLVGWGFKRRRERQLAEAQ